MYTIAKCACGPLGQWKITKICLVVIHGIFDTSGQEFCFSAQYVQCYSILGFPAMNQLDGFTAVGTPLGSIEQCF